MSNIPKDEIVYQALGRIEEKIDNLCEHVIKQNGSLQKHDDRIKSLELYKSWLIGIGTIIVLIITLDYINISTIFK